MTTFNDCTDMDSAFSCVADLDLLIIGAHGDDFYAETVTAVVDEALYNGTPVLYLHTKGLG